VTPQQEITMKSIITLHATPNAWLTNSVLAPHLDALITHLQQGRYAANTTKGYYSRHCPFRLLDNPK
jgi:hypothetical protein